MGAENGGRRRRRRPDPAVGSTGARFPRSAAGSDPAAPEGRHAAPAPTPAPTPADVVGPDGQPLDARFAAAAPADDTVGRTGARFNSRARRWRRDRARAGDTASTAEIETAGAPEGGSPAGAEWGAPPATPDRAPPPPRGPAAAATPSAAAPSAPSAAAPFAAAAPATETASSRGAGVRPYVRTGGRTRARLELALETLVSRPGTPAAPSAPDTEHRAIEAICSEPRSVAEVAALLVVPLGVARVLIADMAACGLLVVHPTAGQLGTAVPDLSVVERVLTGLQPPVRSPPARGAGTAPARTRASGAHT